MEHIGASIEHIRGCERWMYGAYFVVKSEVKRRGKKISTNSHKMSHFLGRCLILGKIKEKLSLHEVFFWGVV